MYITKMQDKPNALSCIFIFREQMKSVRSFRKTTINSIIFQKEFVTSQILYKNRQIYILGFLILTSRSGKRSHFLMSSSHFFTADESKRKSGLCASTPKTTLLPTFPAILKNRSLG